MLVGVPKLELLNLPVHLILYIVYTHDLFWHLSRVFSLGSSCEFVNQILVDTVLESVFINDEVI